MSWMRFMAALSALLMWGLLGACAAPIPQKSSATTAPTSGTETVMATVTNVATAVGTPTQIPPYPLPTNGLPTIIPSPTAVIKLTPRPSSVLPVPCCNTSVPTLSAQDQLRQVLMSVPADRRFIIDQDTIAVIGIGIGNPSDGQERRDRMVIAPHHIPSLSVINIDINNKVISTDYHSEVGRQRLEALLTNPAVMAELHNFLATYVNKLPQ